MKRVALALAAIYAAAAGWETAVIVQQERASRRRRAELYVALDEWPQDVRDRVIASLGGVPYVANCDGIGYREGEA